MDQIHPSGVWLTVNRRCNFRCKWCYAEGTGYKPTDEMPLELAKMLVNTAQQIGVQKFVIIGGEPTLWQPLIEFNKFCTNMGICSVLVTNGMRFGIDSFWQRYIEYPNHNIGLSLKAAAPKQLLKVAGVRNFELARKGIVRATQEINAQVSITYNMFYVDSLIDMTQFAVDCGAKTVKIDFCSTTFIDKHPHTTYMVRPRELAENIMRDYYVLEQITDGHIVFEMMVPFCLWPSDFIEELKKKGQLLSVCHVHKRKGLIFDVNGNVIICNALFNYPMGRYGNEFSDGLSLLAWLNTPKIMSYYDRIGCYPSVACKECRWYQDCAGGCPLRWALYKPNEIIRPILG